ncbi:uncharacterized protein [Ptychodera flava]|uniref:uncharacterized protein n=1 Tax=Ptychodera flava TaxID=63121 RepID=UPI00396A6564
MYTDREDILTVTWRDFYDDESDIDSFAVALYDGMTCAGNVQPLLLQNFVDVFANDTEYMFLDLTLRVNQPYFVHLRATNKAGSSTTLVSRPVFVDLKEPVAGLIKDGRDFKVDVDYQSVTNVLEGVFLHLPTSEGRSCPSRDFSSDKFTADNGWHTVNSHGVWGISQEDTVIFRPSQVVTGNQNDDLSITITRDITKDRMYSGAIYQTNPDVTGGGKYSIDIIAASSNLSAITSVVFWDGPTGIVGDYNAPLFRKEWFDGDREYDDCALCCNRNTTLDGGGTCLCNCTEYFDRLRTSTAPPETTRMTTSEAPPTTTVPWEIENEVPPDDTFQGDASLKLVSHQSMGFQLHPAIEVDGEIKHFIAVWFRHQNESTEPENFFIEQLDFDPSEAWHSYMMEVTPIKNELSFELYIDGRSVVYMSGLVPFSENTQFTIFVRNSNGNVASFDDVFNPPSTTASFRNIRFPPSSDALCRFGEPFRSGDNPIIAFYAGIGSEKLMDDVVPFFEVNHPCVPCSSPCVSGICDEHCSTTVAKRHFVRIDNIELSTNRTVEEDGQLQVVPAVYYITVKAVTGSGRYVVASSDGVYVDDTPPIFDYLYHVDKTWSEDEPVTFQGSNSTIAVRWSAYDIGSQVYEFKWAIGTTPNGTDIQDFVSVGLDNFAFNEKLEGVLEDRKTYFVTVHAINNAGLSTVVITSGVTPILTPPDVSNSSITVRCGDSKLSVSGLCGDQSATGLTWDEVEDDSIGAYYFSIGSTEDTDDVFPMFQVGLNESGTVEIMNGAIHIGGEKIANISDIRTLSDGSEKDKSPDDTVYKSRFLMEPGRTLVSKITVCNKGHFCKKMAMSKTTITRTSDLIGKPGNDSRIEMKLVSHEAGPHCNVSINVLSETQPGIADLFSLFPSSLYSSFSRGTGCN